MEPRSGDDARKALEVQRRRLIAAKAHERESNRWRARYIFQRVDNHIGERLEIAMRSKR